MTAAISKVAGLLLVPHFVIPGGGGDQKCIVHNTTYYFSAFRALTEGPANKKATEPVIRRPVL